MTKNRNKSPRPPSLRVTRFVDTTNVELREFTDRMGQALTGKGRTYSLGSMGLTLFESRAYNAAVRSLTAHDRSRIDIAKLSYELETRLSGDDKTPHVQLDGLGFYGQAYKNKRVDSFVRLGFKLARNDGRWLVDHSIIADVFSDNNLPAPEVNEDPHITFGDVYFDRLFRGSGENPNLLIPKRLYIPGEIALYGVGTKIRAD